MSGALICTTLFVVVLVLFIFKAFVVRWLVSLVDERFFRVEDRVCKVVSVLLDESGVDKITESLGVVKSQMDRLDVVLRDVEEYPSAKFRLLVQQEVLKVLIDCKRNGKREDNLRDDLAIVVGKLKDMGVE